MKLAFQDIDGVMNRNATFKAMKHNPDRENPTYHLDEGLVRRMDAALRECGVDAVVLSTNWRETLTQRAITHYLGQKGYTLPIIGMTPRIEEPAHWKGFTWLNNRRGLEIQWWLETHYPNETWRDLHLAIVDDVPNMGTLSRWHVHTSELSGFIDRDRRRMQKVLEKPLSDQVRWKFNVFDMTVNVNPIKPRMPDDKYYGDCELPFIGEPK